MDGSGQISPQQFVEAMRGEFEKSMRRVADAVNTAPEGAWIDASEHPVRDAMSELRQAAYNQAAQMRTTFLSLKKGDNGK